MYIMCDTMLMGQVKWFNNRQGFGFISYKDGMDETCDVFVHHSGIEVDTEQYKYLVQGEYVTFSMKECEGEHKYQATGVRGVNGGKLMCETRHESARTRPYRDDKQFSGRGRRMSRRGGVSRGQERKPLLVTSEDGSEFTLVPKSSQRHTQTSKSGIRGRGGVRGRGSGRGRY
jgi:cold shock CspA family protein